MNKLKYLAIFVLPLAAAVSFLYEGVWSYLTAFIFFILIPLVELFIPIDSSNLEGEELEKAKHDQYYNILLYLMVPIQYGFLTWFLFVVQEDVSLLTTIGRVISMGLMCGIIGINLGHELGHRLNRFENTLGDLLLLTSLENHFVPYHNRGHHNDVGTPNDPATARLGEPVYVFWFRSQIGSYFKAWEIELNRMKIMKKASLSLSNKMVQYTIAHILIISVITIVFGWLGLVYFLIVAIIGILLLETVNYIEHYGLIRVMNENGRYEHVKRKHSWNSDHVLGRSILFELSRHSDHHFKADRPYQVLESRDESPSMPTGYPGMIIMSLVPPLFFTTMNPRVRIAREI